MSRSPHAVHLRDSLDELVRALGHLQYSAEACDRLPTDMSALSEEELSIVEAFTSRFARVIDLLTKRVLRALDHFELHDAGTLLDVANRAEKRGLIESVDWLRELKDTRNRIAHDYAGDRLTEILDYCREEWPHLSETCQRTLSYGNRLLGA